MSDSAAALGAADWLGLAATPTFAGMALLTSGLGGGQMTMICSTAQDASPLSGMAAMYLLMGAFHSAPWLKLCGRLFSRSRQIPPHVAGSDGRVVVRFAGGRDHAGFADDGR